MGNDRSLWSSGLAYLLAALICIAPAVSYGELLSAVLPSSRSVQVATMATAFASVINTGPGTATSCFISPTTSIPAAFLYQTTDAATNAPVGTANTPVDIVEGAAQSFVFAFTPSAPFAPIDVGLTFDCANTNPAASISGLNTLLLSSSSTPVPDVVALTATPTGDGIVNLPGSLGSNAFAVASVNVGSQGLITASADTGTASLAVMLSICETDPATAECLSAPASSVTTSINAGATPTFSVFVTGTGTVPFDPATNRVFVRFRDAGGVTRGSTSVALRTDVGCGEIIAENTTLHADLVCPGDAEFAIDFGASFITLDLGGFSIVGQSAVPGSVTRGVTATEREGITIRNGTIEGFGEGIFISSSDQVTLSSLNIRNPRGIGVNLRVSTGVLVEDSVFDLPLADLPDVEVEGIILHGGALRVRNTEVRNGTVGVNFSFADSCDVTQTPSNGEVVDTTIAGAYLSGIRVACSTNVRIAGNDIATAPQHGAGIVVDAPFLGGVTGVTVEDNTVHDAGLGIEFRGVTDSSVSRNQVNGSQGWGVAMMQSLGCDQFVPPLTLLPGGDCFYSTANLISDNVALGNSPDLYHDAGSTGNTWTNNTCATKIGSDIPDC